jgi:FkbM family methyltransferase
MYLNFLISKLKLLFKKPIIIKNKNYSLELPCEHKFSNYSYDYPRYDKVILEIIKNLNQSKESVIDIGANCGETLIPMYFQNKFKNYFGIEADSYFFNFLKENICKNNLSNKIKISHNFITNKKVSGKLISKPGTKEFIYSKDNEIINQISLDIFVKINCIKNVKLIKIDTDGFDFNVLKSGLNIIKKYKPIIFFECYVQNEAILKSYYEILVKLKKTGYSTFLFFDNFGNFLIKIENEPHFKQLLNYILNQSKQKKKSIYYFDILACAKKDNNVVKQLNKI